MTKCVRTSESCEYNQYLYWLIYSISYSVFLQHFSVLLLFMSH